MVTTEKNKKIQEQALILTNQIALSNTRLQQVQKECDHPEYYLEFKQGSGVHRICNICLSEVGYPTSDELRDFLGAETENK